MLFREEVVNIINIARVNIDNYTRQPHLLFEKHVCRSGSNSYNWTWNNRLFPNRIRIKARLYIVTLLI